MLTRIGMVIGAVLWSGVVAHAASLPVRPEKHEAAVVLSADTPAAPVPAVVRCGRGQRVGVWLEGPRAEGRPPLRVDGCEIGVMLDDPPDVADGLVTATLATAPALVGAQVTGCLYGFGVGGSGGSTLVNNIAEGCEYGIVVYTDRNIIQGNQLRNIRVDGILVMGHLNSVVANRVTGAGRYGLAVVGLTPMVGPGTYIPILRRAGRQNSLRDNVISGSGRTDLYQWPVSCTNLGNTYVTNTAGTRSASCMK